MNRNITDFLNGLGKVELQSEVVELGMLQDLDNINKSVTKGIVNHKAIVLSAFDSLEKAAKNALKLESEFNALNKGISAIEAQMKELGIQGASIKELTTAKLLKEDIVVFIKGMRTVDSTVGGLRNRI